MLDKYLCLPPKVTFVSISVILFAECLPQKELERHTQLFIFGENCSSHISPGNSYYLALFIYIYSSLASLGNLIIEQICIQFPCTQLLRATAYEHVHCKKGQPFPWRGIIQLFPASDSLVSDIPAMDGKSKPFFTVHGTVQEQQSLSKKLVLGRGPQIISTCMIKSWSRDVSVALFLCMCASIASVLCVHYILKGAYINMPPLKTGRTKTCPIRTFLRLSL